MRKFTTTLLVSLLVLGLVGCSKTADNATTGSNEMITASADSNKEELDETSDGATTAKETVTITTLNANQEEVEIEVKFNPQRIAVLDMAALDIIDNIGMGDRVVGSARVSLDYLSEYSDNSEIKNLGTIKEVDLEAVMACEPDVIFIGGRLAASYDALSEIAPVVFLEVDTEIGVAESVTNNAMTIASLFDAQDIVTEKVDNFKKRIETLQAAAEGKSALIGMTTSGSFNLLGNDGRCSIIGIEIGFDNLAADENSSTHGNESSFETVVKMNPDYIFVMDRDSAINAEGAQMAKEIMENELVMKTDAYKNGNIVYLANPGVWYTAEGGITALDVMLSDLEAVLLAK